MAGTFVGFEISQRYHFNFIHNHIYDDCFIRRAYFFDYIENRDVPTSEN